MSLLEVCINSDDVENLSSNIETSFEFGAKRIELCGAMQHEGLTPTAEAIQIAKQATATDGHLAVMIRPRAGNFIYSEDDIILMSEQIQMAAECGADSVVFGLINSASNTINIEQTIRLITLCKKLGLGSVFHRAFDVLDDPILGVKTLAKLGFSRILTAGTRWGSNAPLEDGLVNIKQWLTLEPTNIEIIIGGGLNKNNIQNALELMSPHKLQVSFHTHSAVIANSQVDGKLVDQLVTLIKQANNT